MVVASDESGSRIRARADELSQIEDPGVTAARMVASTSEVRYFHITLWAVFLATVVPIRTVAVWYAATMAAGVLRQIAERVIKKKLKPHKRDVQRVYALIAMASCAFWAAAPVLAWRADHPFS